MVLTLGNFNPGLTVWPRMLSADRIATALAVTLIFTAVARGLRGVSRSGAVAGALISLILYVCAGAGAFVALISVFVLTFLATRLRYQQKQRMGTAEKSNGRTASQVVANIGWAGAAALLFAAWGNVIFLLACISALAEAAADTVSSEFGQAVSQNPRLITTWKSVPSGTDGAVSLAGTLAGVIAGFAVCGVSASVGLLPWRWSGIGTGAAVFGMVVDSLLGATLEKQHWLNNNAVNFFSTLAAALFALFLALKS